MRMKYCGGVRMPHARRKPLRVCSSAELLITEMARQATCPRTLLENKGVIHLDLDKSRHVSRSVLQQSCNNYVICLPLCAT